MEQLKVRFQLLDFMVKILFPVVRLPVFRHFGVRSIGSVTRGPVAAETPNRSAAQRVFEVGTRIGLLGTFRAKKVLIFSRDAADRL